MPDWRFDPAVGTYRDPKGNPRSYAVVRAAFDKRVAASGEAMRGHAVDFNAGKITLAEFEKRMRAEVKVLHVQGRVLGVGGKASATKSDYGKAGHGIKGEYRYLRGFVKDIEDGRHTAAGIEDRAGKYAGSNAIRQFEDGRKGVMRGAGYTEMRFAGPDDDRTCTTCRDRIARGWVSIEDDGLEIGDSECMSSCRHTLEYRKGEGEG